jgi:hypothetical protein
MSQEIVFHRTDNDHDLSVHVEHERSVRQQDIGAEAAEEAWESEVEEQSARKEGGIIDAI